MQSETENKKIFVFLGPSLSLEEAKEILPQAYYLEPIRCGDILRILRLQPDIIVIIDGYFESTASVWHKEIIYAMQKNIVVFAGGSIGALRAAELYDFGIQLIGKIAGDYLNNILQDDDEVCVLHAQKSFEPLTDGMVNIRSTLEAAKRKGILSEELADQLCHAAKEINYRKRKLTDIIECFRQAYENEMKNFEAWLSQGNFIDLKKEDAKEVLTAVKALAHKKLDKTNSSLNKTIFFRALQRNSSCRPFGTYYNWLPIQEKVALFARYLDSNYRLIRRFAYLLSTCYGIFFQKHDINSSLNQLSFNCFDNVHDDCWCEKYDCKDDNKEAFIKRITKINFLLQSETIDEASLIPSDYLYFLLVLSGEYLVYKNLITKKKSAEIPFSQLLDEIIGVFKKRAPQRYHLMWHFSMCWWYIEKQILKRGLQLTASTLENESNSLRETKKLYTVELMEEWLRENDLKINHYQQLISANARLSIIVIQNNTDILGDLSHADDSWWFLDALYLSGFYPIAKEFLENPGKLKQIKNISYQHNKLCMEPYALSLDFIKGESDFLNFPIND